MSEPVIDEELLEDLYSWIDEIPFSRPKKDIKRDFSDGVLVAEIVKHYCPRVIELHNYPPANKADGKLTNWKLLNRKVFKKLGFELGDDVFKNVSSCRPWAIEQVLMLLRRKIDRFLYEENRIKRGGPNSDQPEADQGGGTRGGYNQYGGYVPSQPQQKGPAALTESYSRQYTQSRYEETFAKWPTQYSTEEEAMLPFLSANHDIRVQYGLFPLMHADQLQQQQQHHQQPPPPMTHVAPGPSSTAPPPRQRMPPGGGGGGGGGGPEKPNDFVPKVLVEEKEQEILTKEETIQILQAKVRRLEHLLHLKDIRIDDLQGRLERLEAQLRPTAVTTKRS